MSEIKVNNSASVAETADLANNVCATVENTSITDTYLSTLVQTLKALVAVILKGMATSKGKELKEAVDNADIYRDSLLMALTCFLKGFIYWGKEATATEAKLLLKTIEAQGSGITRLSYEKESAKMDAILKDYETEEMVQALATTNLTGLAGDLKTAQASFASLYQQSAAKEAIKAGDEAPSSYRREAQSQIKTIVNYVKTMASANASTYGTLSPTLVKLVEDLNQKVRTRNASKERTDGSTSTDTTNNQTS
jgi:hypothetical protein